MLAIASQPANGCPPSLAIAFPHDRGASPAAPSPAAIDPQALAKHRPQLLKYALRELRDAAIAEDVVQETLLAALQGIERFRGGAALRTWLTGILKHKIADHYRRGRREIPLADDDDALDAQDPERGERAGAAAPADWGDPEAAFAQERFFEVLERGLARLPTQTARAFHMREVQGLSTDEICQALGITPAHCAVLLYRARMALRDFLQKEWFAESRASA